MDTNKLNELKECFNKEIDSKIEECLLREKKEEIKTLPLYQLCNIFESFGVELLNKPQCRGLFRKYINTIEENKEVHNEYWFNHILSETKGVSDKKVFIDEALKFTCPITSVHDRGMQAISQVVCEAIDALNFSSSKVDECVANAKNDLNEAIHYVYDSRNRMNKKDLAEYSNKLSYIYENISPANNEEVSESKQINPADAKKFIEESLNTKDGLLEWESAVVKDKTLSVLAGEDASKVFENYRSECLSIIEGMIKDTTIESYGQLQTMKEELETKKYDPLTESEDLLKLSELKHVLLKG